MPAKKKESEYTSLSNVEHDGELVLKTGDPVDEEAQKKLGPDALNELYDTGVIVESALLPPQWMDRPEGNSDRVGFRVPDISEMAARTAKEQQEANEKGETPEVKG